MKGLILKDLYIIKETLSTTLAIIAILIIYCVIRGYGIGLAVIPPIIFAATTTSSLKLDWIAKWDKEALTMPITRNMIIKSKYIELISLCFIGAVAGFVLSVSHNFLVNEMSTFLILNIAMYSFVLGLISGSMHIYLAYKLGGDNLENSEILLFIAIGFSTGIMAICLWIAKKFVDINFNAFSLTSIIIVSIAFFVVLIMYIMTAKVYNKREL